MKEIVGSSSKVCLIAYTGGHFVCKVFDMFTPFSAGLFYLLYRCFRTVCLFKPVTSRPANSERYAITVYSIHLDMYFMYNTWKVTATSYLITELLLWRYIVCKELMPGHQAVHEYLFAVNEELINLHETLRDIHSVHDLFVWDSLLLYLCSSDCTSWSVWKWDRIYILSASFQWQVHFYRVLLSRIFAMLLACHNVHCSFTSS